MNASPNVPQDYGHPEHMSAEKPNTQTQNDEPSDPRLSPEIMEDPTLNKRDGSDQPEERDENPSLPIKTD